MRLGASLASLRPRGTGVSPVRLFFSFSPARTLNSSLWTMPWELGGSFMVFSLLALFGSIQRLDPIYANFTVTESDLPEVQRQMSRGTLKAGVRLPSDPENSTRSGRVEFLDNSVQNGSGTVNLRATMSNPDHHFWPGQFVDVKLVLNTEKAAVLIPNQAAQISQQGPFVYVLKADDTAELRPVKLGQRQGDDVVVTEGVAANERVVLAGQMLVRPGGKVRVDSSAASAPPSKAVNPAGSTNGGRS